MRVAPLLLVLALTVALAVAVPTPGDYPQGPCTPNETTEYQCNQCRCAQDGSGFICTRRVCPPVEAEPAPQKRDAEFSCTPNASFKSSDGCNDCICSSDGKHAACTAKLCLGPSEGAQS